MADTQYRRGRNPMQVADDDSSRDAAGSQRAREENRKPKWERAGMTRSEYERGLEQLTREKLEANKRQADLDRARRGQSNPGN